MDARRIFALAALAPAALSLGACGYRHFAHRATNPVIEDVVRQDDDAIASVVSTKAERRTIIFKGTDRVCAEPPPDVGEAISAQALSELSTKEVAFGYGHQFATAILQLGQRSQGLELYRTGSFVLCNMYVNGVIDRLEYQAAMSQLLTVSKDLISEQIRKGLPTDARGGTVSAPDQAGMGKLGTPKLDPKPKTDPKTEPKTEPKEDSKPAAEPGSKPEPPKSGGASSGAMARLGGALFGGEPVRRGP